MRKLILLTLIALLSIAVPPIVRADSIMGMTSVNIALENSLDSSGRWTVITFADDTTMTTAAVGGTGDVEKVGTPVDNQVGVWTGDPTLEGSVDLTFDGLALAVAGKFEVLQATAGTPYFTLSPSLDDGILFCVDATSGGGNRNIIITDITNIAKDHQRFSLAADPNLSLYSATSISSATDEWMNFRHDKTNGVFTLGSGYFDFQSQIRVLGNMLTAGSGSGGCFNEDSSLTNPTLIPDWADSNSGVGGSGADAVALIAGGLPGVTVTETASETLTEIASGGVDTSPILELSNTARDIQWFLGNGIPEGIQTGNIGDKYTDTVGGIAYIKNTGAGNTGWVICGGLPVYKSYSLANPGSAGTYYVGGHYDFEVADSTLTIGGTVTQTFGIASEATGVHAFCVASGAGGTDLVLTVTGVSITELGVKNDADSQIIVADTDTATLDQYFETSKKWLGQITFTLTGSSGAFTFNYGHVKYEDFGNRDFTVTDFESTGAGSANETGLNIELLHHESTAFLYHATAFVPNQTPLISLATDYGTNNNISNGENFSYKRRALATVVDGADSEGLLIRVTTEVNNSINDATFHLGALLR